MSGSAGALSRGAILRRAAPIIVANATLPMLGLVDTAVIGHAGTVHDLGGVALASLVFGFLYWSFGFLRMGTTGFVAQALGAGDHLEVRAALGRALAIAGLLGCAITLLGKPLGGLSLALLHGSGDVEEVASRYIAIRVWGAPASLATFALRGTLIGLGLSRDVLRLELVLNGLNLLLDLLLAGWLRLGALGIALGTAGSEWLAFGFAARLVYLRLRPRVAPGETFWPRQRIRQLAALRATLSANGDIMVRTVALLFGFAWFTDRSASFGDTALAANHLLLEIISFTSFFLDGYAYVAEALVGQAIGGRSLGDFDLAVRRSSELALASAVLLALGVLAFGPFAVGALTSLAPVRAAAVAQLPCVAAYVALSVAAFQLDGIFIGATGSRAMRNASLVSTLAFLGMAALLIPVAQVRGLWLAFIGFVVVRALSLGAAYPALRRQLAA